MRKPKFILASEVAKMIDNDSTVVTIGMTLVSSSESILKSYRAKLYVKRNT